jgi:hypothetical protein
MSIEFRAIGPNRFSAYDLRAMRRIGMIELKDGTFSAYLSEGHAHPAGSAPTIHGAGALLRELANAR